MSSIIYKITCIPTGKIYVGQTSETKNKGKKSAIEKRWACHVGNKKHKTPLIIAIKEYGPENFRIEELERCEKNQLDEFEAKWIENLNSVYPNGLNAYRFGRSKFNNDTTIQNHFKDKVIYAKISPIKTKGVYNLVYLKIKLNDDTTRRITFKPKKEGDIEDSLRQAREFCKDFTCKIEEENYTSTDLSERYSIKLKLFDNKQIVKIRIVMIDILVSLYIYTIDDKDSKEMKKICFGGKHILKKDAYETALKFIKLLNISKDCIIEDNLHSSLQQVTAD